MINNCCCKCKPHNTQNQLFLNIQYITYTHVLLITHAGCDSGNKNNCMLDFSAQNTESSRQDVNTQTIRSVFLGRSECLCFAGRRGLCTCIHLWRLKMTGLSLDKIMTCSGESESTLYFEMQYLCLLWTFLIKVFKLSWLVCQLTDVVSLVLPWICHARYLPQ